MGILFANCAYLGEIKGQTMQGGARFIDNNEWTGEPWLFEVTRNR